MRELILGGDCSNLVRASSLALGNYGNLMVERLPGLKHDTGLAVDWSFNEQAILNDGLIKFAGEQGMLKYVKIVALLPEKTVRDVALRCRWMAVDKASILGDAIKYVKELEHTVKSLEDQKVKKTVESVVLVKKSKLSTDDNDSSVNGTSSSEVCSNSGENFDGSTSRKLLPEIQVRLSEKTVLLRIHCENDKGVLVKVLSEIEKLGLMVTNASVMPFV